MKHIHKKPRNRGENTTKYGQSTVHNPSGVERNSAHITKLQRTGLGDAQTQQNNPGKNQRELQTNGELRSVLVPSHSRHNLLDNASTVLPGIVIKWNLTVRTSG